ncbi:G2/M phase-specific E3 ubiquitin-protein ligase-like, partial [Clarias magur]
LQILLPCHNKLVEPSLSTKQTLNGALVKKLFNKKSIHVRPDKVLLTEEKELSIPDGDSQHTNSSDSQEASDGIN